MAKIVGKPRKDVDTDHDGLSDWEEVNVYGSDPLDDDTNSDGISDGETVRIGFHPVTGQKLKDFFVPHEGNNYQPKSLHPKRVLFHLGSVILIKIMIIAFVLVYPLSVWMSPDIIASQEREIINQTNQLRQNLGVGQLSKNELLDQSAYDKVQDMFINQYFAHTSPQLRGLKIFLDKVGYRYKAAGENLAIGFDDVISVMKAWQESPLHYANLIDTDFEEIGVAVAEGKFEDKNTVLIAQHFGSQLPEIKKVAEVNEINNVVEPIELVEISKVKTTEVIIDQPQGRQEGFVKVEAELDEDVVKASADVLGNQVELTQNDQGSWQANEIIYDTKEAVIAPASLTTVNNKNEIVHEELAVAQVKPQETSLVDQYLMLRSNPDSVLNKIFDVSSIYFVFMLVLACLALIFNIFIEIRKQHPKLIFSGLGLVLVLAVLIVL